MILKSPTRLPWFVKQNGCVWIAINGLWYAAHLYWIHNPLVMKTWAVVIDTSLQRQQKSSEGVVLWGFFLNNKRKIKEMLPSPCLKIELQFRLPGIGQQKKKCPPDGAKGVCSTLSEQMLAAVRCNTSCCSQLCYWQALPPSLKEHK